MQNNYTYTFTYNGLTPVLHLRATNPGANNLTLTWNHTNENVTTFRIHMKTLNANESWTTLEDRIILTPPFSYVVSNLNESSAYQFRVFAALNNLFELTGATVNGYTTSGLLNQTYTTGTTGNFN